MVGKQQHGQVRFYPLAFGQRKAAQIFGKLTSDNRSFCARTQTRKTVSKKINASKICNNELSDELIITNG